MIITLTSTLVGDLLVDLEGRAEVYRDDCETEKEAAVDAAAEWLGVMAQAIDYLRDAEIEVAVPAEHQAEIGLSMENLEDLQAERRRRSN